MSFIARVLASGAFNSDTGTLVAPSFGLAAAPTVNVVDGSWDLRLADSANAMDIDNLEIEIAPRDNPPGAAARIILVERVAGPPRAFRCVAVDGTFAAAPLAAPGVINFVIRETITPGIG